jgi:hypothetical protein
MWVAYGLVVAVIVAAALFDWHARRHGHHQRSSSEYWHAVREARREAGREARSRWFGGRRL